MENDEQQYSEPIYKRWFRTKDKSGFISIIPWFDNEKGIVKLNIDVGESDPSTNALRSSTNAFVDAYKFGSFVKAIANDTAKSIFPSKNKKINNEWKPDPDHPTDESIAFYGGSNGVARIIRIHHWQTPNGYDSSAFVVKIGHFEGNTSHSGAIIADMSKIISRNQIKVSRQEMAEISYIIETELIRR